MSLYTVIVQEYQADLEELNKNGYLLQVAKSVSKPGGEPTFSVVYASAFLGPYMSVSWQENYAINWSTQVSAPGAQVVYSGNWTPCALGASFKLDANGIFQPDPNNPNADKNSLNVSSNDYPVPVNIIVGVSNPKQPSSYTPIWVDPTQLIKSAHGEFTPRESVQLWYQSNDQTATMISGKATPADIKDMTTNQKWWFYYNVAGGAWQDQSVPFPTIDNT